jgi:hypothetical protein
MMLTNPVLAQLMVDLQTAVVEHRSRLFWRKELVQSEPLAGERIAQSRDEVDVLGITPLSILRQ